MSRDYFVMYNPLTFNLMELANNSEITPVHLISYLTNLNGFDLRNDNYVDYLEFDLKKERQGMVETFAMESYAALYIGNQIASFSTESRVIQVDGKRRTLREVIFKEGKKPKAVFITAMSSNFPTAVATSIILNYDEIPVILGGIHVSTSPDDVGTFILKYCPHPELVSQVIGAGDSKVISQIIYDLDNNILKPGYDGYITVEDNVWRPRKNVSYMPTMRIEMLSRIPIVGNFLAKRMWMIPVAPFVGCPYSCNFCSISTLPKNKRKLTIRSTKDFLDELEEHQKEGGLGSRLFFFLPDNLLLGGKKLDEMLDGLIERRLKVNFATQISIDVASNEDLLKKLRLAGATHFFVGFESLDIRNLEYIGKHILHDLQKTGLTLVQYYQKQIQKIQEYGISIHGAFIFGLPFDYFNSIDDHTGIEIAQFCIDNYIGLQPCSLTDLPGSQTFRESQETGTWLYGKQGTMDYLIALCLTDLTETNRKPPDSLDNSPLKVASMAFESIQRAGATRVALRNAIYMMKKSFAYPTARGRSSYKERIIDSIFAFTSQLVVSLYKEHGERVSYSAHGIKGAFERLYNFEKNPAVQKYFKSYVEKFKEKGISSKNV